MDCQTAALLLPPFRELAPTPGAARSFHSSPLDGSTRSAVSLDQVRPVRHAPTVLTTRKFYIMPSYSISISPPEIALTRLFLNGPACNRMFPVATDGAT